MLGKIIINDERQLKTMLILEADKTLAAEDTGALFWEKLNQSRGLPTDESPLKPLFSSCLKYSYTAFRQAMPLYEDAADDQEFDSMCTNVASAVTTHLQKVSLLQSVGKQENVGAVVITCGLRQVWEKVMERAGLSKTVAVIGGGRLAEGIVVTAMVKGALVTRMRYAHLLRVWAFGDSSLDIENLCEAHEAIVMVGEERSRSQTMDTALMNAIDNNGLRARQVILPKIATAPLDTTKLPVIQLEDRNFVSSLLSHPHYNRLQFLHATDNSGAKILATPMRDAGIAGPALRKAHHQVGFYLAIEFMTDLIGLEKNPVTHVLGSSVSGYRLSHESQTLIVALMRGGEPMALGVSEAFQKVIFLHAKEPKEIKSVHVQEVVTVILVDSVINSGKTVVDFVRHVKILHPTGRVVIVADVVQDRVISEGGLLDRELGYVEKVSLVALRLSETKFTGKKNTDTGNRLFNTTHLD